MKALIMAGGKGGRLGYVEKPLIIIKNKFLIDLILDEVKKSEVEDFYIAVSPYTPETKRYLEKSYKDKIIETPGNGFIEDINYCFKFFDEPFLVIPSDIYGLTYKIINKIISSFSNEYEALTVLNYNKPIGLNIVSPKDGYQKEKILNIYGDIVNLNTPEDLKKVGGKIWKRCPGEFWREKR
ncbi:NTP transferase domain-containing protein [Methanocaldococcus infernus]